MGRLARFIESQLTTCAFSIWFFSVVVVVLFAEEVSVALFPLLLALIIPSYIVAAGILWVSRQVDNVKDARRRG